MNTGMWESAVTQENIAALAARGVVVVEPDDGELACGVKGKGRMMEPEAILSAIAGMEA
jgi:phosphopantothenoylcysteine decarboxylase/phosphopantothenate--cysteine ligase